MRNYTASLAFAIALFLSGFLITMLPQMILKMMLPKFGASIENVQIIFVFIQTLVLLGFAYAALVSLISRGWQIWAQYLIFLASFCVLLPVPFNLHSWAPAAGAEGTVFTVLALTTRVALPCFALATFPALLQLWLANTDLPGSDDPYFLFSLYNFGALFGLVGYPMVIEPWVALQQQAWLWALGFFATTFLLYTCARCYRRSSHQGLHEIEIITPGRRFGWILLAAFPCVVRLASRLFSSIPEAIPAMALIAPGLYLLSFIIAFARPTKPGSNFSLWVTVVPPCLVVFALLVWFSGPTDFAASQWASFAIAMMCHTLLARSRPSPRYLPEYYVLVAVGSWPYLVQGY